MAKIIDSSLLGDSDVEITFDRPIFTVSNFGKSFDRIEMQKEYRRADILYSERATSISFTQPLAGVCKRLELRVSSEPLVLQLSSMVLICKCLSGSALVLGVEQLHLSLKRPPSNGEDDSERKQWLEIIHHFRGTKWVHMAGDHPTNIVFALQLSNSWREPVLPALHKLSIQDLEQHDVPLREAVSSFMHSRRLSGSFIGVEYERLWIDEPCVAAGPFPQRATIESLSSDILLNIFIHCLEAFPKFWPTLVHVCQTWRQVVFTSTRSLHLRLRCKHGTPVSKTLDCWPALPIVVQYGGSSTLDPPAPEDEGNVLAALKQSDRVNSISLTITGSLLEKFSTIEEPFSELEELDLLTQNNAQLTLPSVFQWGPRLRSLRLTRIAIPTLPQLSSSTDLVDLQLYEIPSAVYISPEAFANALSGMTQLQSLSLHFLSLPPRRNYLGLPPFSGEHIVLPALTCLKYRGTCKYLDTLIAIIDAPRLGDVDITFFNQPTLDASQIGQFIERTETQRSLSQANIIFSESAVSIRFTQPNAPTRLVLRISCKQLDWQLSFMAQILNQFSGISLRVENLGINTTEPPSAQDDVGGEQWLYIFRAFGGAKNLRVSGELATDVLRALHPADGDHSTVLPALRDLHLEKPLSMHGPLWEAVQSFNISRRLSGRPVQVYAIQYTCHLCDTSSEEQRIFKEQTILEKHLEEKHACRHTGMYPSMYRSFCRDCEQTDLLIPKPECTTTCQSESGK